MRVFSAALAALLSFQVAIAKPLTPLRLRSPPAVKETHFVPRGWAATGEPTPDHVLDIKIGLKNKRFAELEQHLYEISNPSHHRYGQHFSKEEVDNLVRPNENASTLVDEWLQDNGIEPSQCSYSSAKDWISVSLPVSQIENMLDTKYSVYRHEDGTSMIRTTSWSLPQHLHEHVSTIQPTTAFLRASPKLQTVLESPDVEVAAEDFPPNSSDLNGVCNWEGVTPACLRTLYGTIDYTPQSPESHIGFTNYLGEVTNRNDTAAFLQQFRKEAVSSAYSFEQISIDGGPIDNGTGGRGYEANLDVETITGQVWPINITSYSTGGSPPFAADLFTPTNTNEPYLTWLDYVLSQSDLPQTISTSYGDDEQTVPLSYAQSVCEGFAQLGLRGVSLLFSSGDNGVGANGTCVSNDGKNTTTFLPAFPASCPYVTTVGGTRGYPEAVAYDTRNGYVSGSGFSNYFAQPAYQKDSGVVDQYIASLNGKLDGLYNKTGRAYPDVAAQGYRYITIYNGSVATLDGTSCSSPTTASIIALVNDALLAAGKSPLGFLNPWLYTGAGAQAFTDVLTGSSTGCNTAGFEAKQGWDVASGWGTPQFPTMLDILGVGGDADQ
ncbi:hypothetical protein H2198_005833 [Neophaeococcomyces mojaviensis]|uniref:Uncharacterized protein n=1 Tax=Neophaeococcomyces mojaviensis TaxID=3383035 RepID=A0ACC3A4P9_9EURO|nr:hypothetical protein H2198_005833 [Knufia sp. JES_112]